MTNTERNAIVNEKALKKVEEIKPNVSEYDNKKGFSELYYNDETFVQVYLFDKTENEYANESKFNIDMDKHDIFLQKVKEYNLKLKEAQIIVLDEMKVSKYSRDNYFYFNRVGVDLGFAHLKTFVRNKEKDRRKQEERERQLEDFLEGNEEEPGPYGGAFSSERDFINWKEGRGFLND